ncbi:hypothetical protein J610_1022 [Acinetobacter sp. 723929]|nr:hypothetical protein J551_1762 [Acinetobacter sp. 1475718]EXI18138.1 hypothetical protein J610_1022 [Acinetobacter sp. 723929]EXS01409.1 hypothetical protein J687_1251 [Acinetobacter sp. 225588]
MNHSTVSNTYVCRKTVYKAKKSQKLHVCLSMISSKTRKGLRQAIE